MELLDNPPPSQWVDRFGDDLYRYAVARMKTPQDAEDIVQETFLAAFKSASSFLGRSSLKTWMLGILRRKIADHYHIASKIQIANSPEDDLDDVFDSDGNFLGQNFVRNSPQIAAMEAAELKQIVLDCVRNLPESQSTVFVLKTLEQRETHEIRKILDISESTYWTRMHRARIAIARCVAAKWEFTGGHDSKPSPAQLS